MKSQPAITKRVKVLFGIMAAFGFIFVIRLFYLQVIKYDYYQNQAVAEHLKELTIPATRGVIYAMNGPDSITPLVLNEPAYTLYADPQDVHNAKETAQDIANVIGGNVGTYTKLLSANSLEYVVLATKLNLSQYNKINNLQLYGVGLTQVQERVYPEGSLASQVLGFVDQNGVGQYGVEGALNGMLAGQDGLLKATTDVRGIPLSTSKEDVLQPAKNGQNILLTIDRNIQNEAQTALVNGLKAAHATTGSVLVMNPSNGDVLAMANVPTYDPSNYQDVTNYSDFQNNTVDYAYEPGSDFKLLTMTAAVNQGAVTPNTTFNNTGTVTVDGDTIGNVESHPGSTTMQVVIDLSLNTGAVFMLQQLGGGQIDQQGKTLLYNYFTQKYGFGQKTGIEQTGEDAGTIYSPTNVQGDDIRYANMTFGQGIDATMIQVASAFDAIVNGGTYYKPQLLAGTVNDQGQVISTTKPDVERAGIITPQTASTIKQVAVTALDATPTLTAINTPGYFTGGKTGTSQVIDPATGAYTNVDPIGTYLGFGGGSGSNATPKYVIMIRVDNSHIPGYSGSTAAAPIFANISNWLINYYGLQPTS